MLVDVERAVAPAHQQAQREPDDHQADQELRGVLHARGQVALEQHDRQPEEHEGRRVAESPAETEPRRPAIALLGVGGDQGRDRREVIGVVTLALS